ncbi:TIR domain-containing protein [Aliivibrio fischeri]|uniref:TIR domain-containing protein n=1 Tax=Aliivibrio fischeri TaxID=668 RepID=UPI00080E1A47|nr:TIR domain-containing protein [Aliivibrio fischeri]OCH01680.1 hypothetical protein A6E10_18415 [Aliivibrio fischeri]
MSYKNKTYVIFDAGNGKVGDKDICFYRTMTMWKQNEKIDFNFHDAHDYNNLTPKAQEVQIKKKLRERFSNAKQVVVLVGENTKSNNTYVLWELEIAQKLNLPIVVAYVNGSRVFKKALCPSILDGANCIHVSFQAKIIKHALDKFPSSYALKDKKIKKNWIYGADIYKELGL